MKILKLIYAVVKECFKKPFSSSDINTETFEIVTEKNPVTKPKCKSNCGCTHDHSMDIRPKSKKKITRKKLIKG